MFSWIRVVWPWLLCLTFCSIAHANVLGSPSVSNCDELTVESEVGVIEAFAYGEARTVVTLRNRSTEALHIKSIRPRRPPGQAEVEQPSLQPGESTRVHIRKPLAGNLGLSRFGFPIVLDLGPPAHVCMLNLPTFTQSAYRPETPVLQVPDVQAGVRTEHRVEFSSYEATALQVTGIEGLPEWMEARVVDSGSPQTIALQLSVLESAPTGYYSGTLAVQTDLAQQPQLGVSLALGVYGAVVPEFSRIDLGGVVLEETLYIEMALRHREAQPFGIAEVKVDSPELSATTEDCGAGCSMLKVRFQGERRGQFSGRVQVDLEDGLGLLVFPVTALLSSADNPIINLGEVGDGVRIRRESSTRKDR